MGASPRHADAEQIEHARQKGGHREKGGERFKDHGYSRQRSLLNFIQGHTRAPKQRSPCGTSVRRTSPSDSGASVCDTISSPSMYRQHLISFPSPSRRSSWMAERVCCRSMDDFTTGGLTQKQATVEWRILRVLYNLPALSKGVKPPSSATSVSAPKLRMMNPVHFRHPARTV